MELLQLTQFLLSPVFFLAVIIVSSFVYVHLKPYIWRLPPGPIGVPLLGYIPFVGKEPYKEIHRLTKIYGPLMRLSLGSFETVVVSDYKYAKELLSHPASLGRPDAFFSFLPYRAGFGGMVGEAWQEQRRFCMHTMRNLGIGRGIWERIIQEDAAEFIEYLVMWRGKPIDVSGPLCRSGMSSIMALLMGRRFTQKETNPVVKLIEKVHRVVAEHGKISNPGTLIPWLVKYMVKFNINGYAEKWDVLQKFCSLFRKEISRRLQDATDYNDSTDFIDYYLEALNKKRATDEKNYYSVDNLIGHALVLFIGGSDTTVASLHWLMLLMASHPEVQKRAQEELDDIIGRHGQVAWDDRKKLPYTMATILEMERWASIVPFFPPRHVTETFEFHGHAIPKDTMIICNGWSIHRDPKHWDNPDEFRPERFLEIAEKSGKDPSKSDGYAVFSFGKRNCPGETIAYMTIFLYFARLMQKFMIKPPPGRGVKMDAVYGAVTNPTSQELCFIER